ncbi:MAG TPA: lipoprotein [Gammaproteobacteria bacterium]|nr:lipoprotein [Pseudomonadota bacterium]MDQ4147288.1 lipoprotein [Pseudomonadota bacterium]HEX2236808.1 lipoprotein [Gammaproteobacteria bacterium]HEX2242634.1 lipoprotein [Gammaproteobacteria bacterium]
MRKTLYLLTCLLCASFLVSSCGQKGDLYLPPQQQHKERR